MNTKMNDETKIVMDTAKSQYENITGYTKSNIYADGIQDFMIQIAEEAQEAGEADELFHYIMLSEKLRSRVDWELIVKEIQSFYPDDENETKVKCAGDCCKEPLVKEESYYLHFPDGTEEWFCEDCQSSLRQSYIQRADYRGYGDGEIFSATSSEDEEDEEEK